MYTIKPVLRKDNKANKENRSVYLRVIISGFKPVYLSTGIKTPEKLWDNGKIKGGTGRSANLNFQLSDLLHSAEKVCFSLNQQNTLTPSSFRALWKSGIMPDNASFREFAEKIFTDYYESKTGTAKHVKSISGRVLDFQPDLQLNQINTDWARKYEYWMRINGRHQNTTANHLKMIRAMLNHAVRMGVINKNGLQDYKIKKAPTTREFLSRDEFEKIKKFNSFSEALCRSRNLFLFQCATGLRYSDIMSLKRGQIKDNCIRLAQTKTKGLVIIPLIDLALNLLDVEDYEKMSPDDYIFKRISNQKYNENLKTIATECGIESNLTSHVARHTFATMALTAGIDIKTVSSLLGHSTVAVTEVYAKIIDSKKREEMTKLNKLYEL